VKIGKITQASEWVIAKLGFKKTKYDPYKWVAKNLSLLYDERTIAIYDLF
jgi:hypothetical protein